MCRRFFWIFSGSFSINLYKNSCVNSSGSSFFFWNCTCSMFIQEYTQKFVQNFHQNFCFSNSCRISPSASSENSCESFLENLQENQPKILPAVLSGIPLGILPEIAPVLSDFFSRRSEWDSCWSFYNNLGNPVKGLEINPTWFYIPMFLKTMHCKNH